jgi:hypothetical protein
MDTQKMSPNDYSKKELDMFALLGYNNLNMMSHLRPPQVYKLAMETIFVNNTQGLAVDSLRRCMRAMWDCKIHRNTPEWDELIQL